MKKLLIPLLAVAVVLSLALSCGQSQQSAKKQSEADSLLKAAFSAQDYERELFLCDSLQQRGDISAIRSAYHRGTVYMSQKNIQLAKEVLSSVIDMKPTSAQDSTYYIYSARNLAEVLSVNNDYEGVLRVALPVIGRLKDMNSGNRTAMGDLIRDVGLAQLSLGMKNDAAESFDKFYNIVMDAYAANPSWKDLSTNFIYTTDIYEEYVRIEDDEAAKKWLTRQDSLFVMIEQEDIPAKEKDYYISTNYMSHGFMAVLSKQAAELDRAIANYQKTEYSKTNSGRIGEGSLLYEAGRYAEAADALDIVDQFLAENAKELSLDNISNFYGGKFKANYKAGRRDSALAVAAFIVENLDSAIAKEKNSTIAELATVYKTQQKDAEIAQQQISLSRQRWIGTLAVLMLLTTFFIIYTWYRRRAENRLGAAHVELQNAYYKLEETTAAKERIESELRIARDIQMSMVPGVFPECEGLDMYAEMIPAKEVGGDLYGYVYLPAPTGRGLEGGSDRLYFCVGDVSGKGVPASLFMAQSARLFRTLAAEGMMPADIAYRMNNALAENNDKGMFVTMFIGMLHLDTARLDFCNCGHNPPVIDGQFLTMQNANQPLGLWEDDPFEGEIIADIRGKQLLIYTDGLNEAENALHELLGNTRLLELMANAQSLDSHQVIDMLCEAVEQHRAGAVPNDDLTLMCLKLS